MIFNFFRKQNVAITSNKPDIFAKAYKSFSGMWYEYMLIRNSFNSSSASQIINPNANPISPISILGGNIKQNVNPDDLKDFLRKVKMQNSLETLFFIAFYLQTERFLRDCDSKYPWDLPKEMPHPKGFFSNIPFDDFIKFNNVIISEIRATRNSLAHNNGIKGASYKNDQKRFFNKYVEVYKDFDSKLKDKNEGLRYLDEVLARMNTKVGERLPITFNYLYLSQLAFLDRIGMKCRYYEVAWSLKEDAVHKIFPPGSSYDFEPFY